MRNSEGRNRRGWKAWKSGGWQARKGIAQTIECERWKVIEWEKAEFTVNSAKGKWLGAGSIGHTDLEGGIGNPGISQKIGCLLHLEINNADIQKAPGGVNAGHWVSIRSRPKLAAKAV